MTRLTRLLSLLPWLRTHPGVRVAEAAAHFGVTEAQLRADLALLYLCGLPGHGFLDLIDIDFAGDTITVNDAQTLGRPLRLTGDEATALLVAARALADLPGLDRGDALERALAKLTAAAGEAAQDRSTVAVELARADTGSTTLPVVRQALEEGRRVRLSYLVEARDELTERDVDPMTVHARDGRLYLEAWCHRAQGIRLFRVDRITAARLLEEPAAPPADAAPLDLADGVFSPGPDDLSVELALTAAARWVPDYHACEEVEELPDGGLRILLRVADPAWVRRLVLRLGGAARVLAPPTLVAEVHAAATQGLAAQTQQRR